MEKCEVKIFDMDGDKGIGKVEDKVVFVENALLGEKCKIRIIQDKKSYYLAEKLETLEESPNFQESRCPYAHICDGCTYQNLSIDGENQVKKNSIINKVNRIAGEDLQDIEFIPSYDEGYRNKIDLKVSVRGIFSYYNKKSHDYVEIASCLIASREINQSIGKFQRIISSLGIKGYSKKNIYGIKGLSIRDLGGKINAIFVFHKKSPRLWSDLKRMIRLKLPEISLYFSENKESYAYGKLFYQFGPKYLLTYICGRKFRVSPDSFFQINRYTIEKIYLKALEYIKEIKTEKLLDLFCGTGTTSLIFSKYFEEIVGVELVKNAVEDGNRALEENEVTNVRFIAARVENVIFDLVNSGFDTALVDPPRRGLDRVSIEAINSSDIKNIVYISCNPATLARDIKAFKSGGFLLKKTCGINNFPRTSSIEAIALLSRKKEI